MMMFARLPSSWIIRDHKLREVQRQDVGVSVAALRILIVLSCFARNDKNVTPLQGSCEISYDKLERFTGVSRPLLNPALNLLEAMQFLTREKVGRRNRYWIGSYAPVDKWCKLPKSFLLSAPSQPCANLRSMPNRSRSTVDALKIYLVLCAFRDSTTNTTQLSYDKITDYTGVLRRNIRMALSLLISCELITVASERDYSSRKNEPNRYKIVGL